MTRLSLNVLYVLVSGLLHSLITHAETSLPQHGHIAPVNGIQLYYESYGEGPPLLLLHNFGSSSTAWASLAPEFAKSYRLIIPDLRGHGRSTNPSSQFTHRQAALDILALLDVLAVKNFMAIGASSGAMTLVHMATQQPSRVEAMVLVGGTDQYVAETRAILRAPDCEVLNPDDWKRMREIHKNGADQILALQREFCGFKDSYDDMNFTPPFLSTITARTLIVHGDHDRFFPIRVPVEMYTAIPHAYLWIVPNGGHIPAYSPKHRVEFIRTALEFLRGDWDKKP